MAIPSPVAPKQDAPPVAGQRVAARSVVDDAPFVADQRLPVKDEILYFCNKSVHELTIM
jgi:hypothetical protein